MLEHAFDSILEAGEIPSVSFFSEMTCQAIIRHDYGRAVDIVNTMAHAPSQVSFQEWIDLFERNNDRIDQASLNDLHEKLIAHDLAKEATVFNLSRALNFICGSCEDSLNSTVSTNQVMDEIDKDSRDGDGKMQGDSDEVSGLSGNRREENLRVRFVEDFEDDELVIPSSYYDDVEFGNVEHDEGDSDIDEFDFERIVPSSEVDDSDVSGTPSAYEILETWKKK